MIDKYYQKNKEKLQKEVREWYQKRQYHRDRNKNLSEEEKEKKVEYTRN